MNLAAGRLILADMETELTVNLRFVFNVENGLPCAEITGLKGARVLWAKVNQSGAWMISLFRRNQRQPRSV